MNDQPFTDVWEEALEEALIVENMVCASELHVGDVVACTHWHPHLTRTIKSIFPLDCGECTVLVFTDNEAHRFRPLGRGDHPMFYVLEQV